VGVEGKWRGKWRGERGRGREDEGKQKELVKTFLKMRE
jgi:hypothetical protein